MVQLSMIKLQRWGANQQALPTRRLYLERLYQAYLIEREPKAEPGHHVLSDFLIEHAEREQSLTNDGEDPIELDDAGQQRLQSVSSSVDEVEIEVQLGAL